jgi:hypothetical protein
MHYTHLIPSRQDSDKQPGASTGTPLLTVDLLAMCEERLTPSQSTKSKKQSSLPPLRYLLLCILQEKIVKY